MKQEKDPPPNAILKPSSDWKEECVYKVNV